MELSNFLHPLLYGQFLNTKEAQRLRNRGNERICHKKFRQNQTSFLNIILKVCEWGICEFSNLQIVKLSTSGIVK